MADKFFELHFGASHQIFKNANDLRLHKTKAEKLLWEALRNNKLGGLKFRRQHPIGTFILDFYCHKQKLAVELDGWHHLQPVQKIADDDRTAQLATLGITVIRFMNHHILEQLDEVLAEILRNAMPDSPRR